MVIIKIKVYFTLLLPAICSGSLRAIFRMKYYLLWEVKYTIDNIDVDFEISDYISKMFKIL